MIFLLLLSSLNLGYGSYEFARNKLGAADREIGETGSAVKSIKMRVWVVGLWFVLWK
jgi:hypothetical protein